MAKSAWLQEVEDDAVRITQKRFRDQEEERQYKLEKVEASKPSAAEDKPQAPSEEVKRAPGRPKKEEE